MAMTLDELYQKAKAVINPRKLSEDADAGGVGAALLTQSGNVYIGVCYEGVEYPSHRAYILAKNPT